MKKKECLPPKIKSLSGRGLGKKEKAQAEAAAGVFFVVFLSILLYSLLQIEVYRASALYLEDALAASNLASAIIDIEEYGSTQNLIIGDPLLAFDRYTTALKGNLNLDDSWQCENKRMISGRVEVIDYVIYNCVKEKIYACRVGEEGILASWEGTLGQERAPNGILVESTGVYSEITFSVEGILGVCTQARKGKLVDIVAND